MMTNHVHLLCTPREEGGISQMMQSLGRRYVQYFNFTYAAAEHCGKDVLNPVWSNLNDIFWKSIDI